MKFPWIITYIILNCISIIRILILKANIFIVGYYLKNLISSRMYPRFRYCLSKIIFFAICLPPNQCLSNSCLKVNLAKCSPLMVRFARKLLLLGTYFKNHHIESVDFRGHFLFHVCQKF